MRMIPPPPPCADAALQGCTSAREEFTVTFAEAGEGEMKEWVGGGGGKSQRSAAEILGSSALPLHISIPVM